MANGPCVGKFGAVGCVCACVCAHFRLEFDEVVVSLTSAGMQCMPSVGVGPSYQSKQSGSRTGSVLHTNQPSRTPAYWPPFSLTLTLSLSLAVSLYSTAM